MLAIGRLRAPAVCFALSSVAVFGGSGTVMAQAVGSGASSTLRGTLADTPRGAKSKADAGPQTVVVIGALGGHTSNAGPTFDETESPVSDHSLFVLHDRPIGGGRLNIQLDATGREFISQSEARNARIGLKGTFTDADTGASVTLAATRSVEIDEKATQTSLSANRDWKTAGQILTPFLTGNLAYLDFTDVDQFFLEFANQDDRDRLSGSVQTGIKLQVTDAVTLIAALGVDIKKYAISRDDFEIDRDNQSVFTSFGAAYDHNALSGSITYAPVYRRYDDDIFRNLFAHTFAAQATLTPADWVNASAAVRYSLEESDFLDTRVMKEFVAIAGLTIAFPDRSSATLEGAYTHRFFDNVGRVDQKYEVQLRAQTPITDATKLTAQIGYLLFATNVEDLSTNQATALVGFVTTIN